MAQVLLGAKGSPSEISPLPLMAQLVVSAMSLGPCFLISMDQQISWLGHGPVCMEAYMFSL